MVALKMSYKLLQESHNFYLANEGALGLIDTALYKPPTPILHSLTYYPLNIVPG